MSSGTVTDERKLETTDDDGRGRETTDDDGRGRETTDDEERQLERADTGQWALWVTIVVFGVGIITASPLLVSLAIIPLGFVAAAGFDTIPEPAVRLERELTVTDEKSPESGTGSGLHGDPGERITVRLAVENTGSQSLVDLRLVDGVPDEIPVISESPRACLSLLPGETAVVEYEIELRRGEHTFGDALLRSRGASNTVFETWEEPVTGSETLQCFPTVQQVPIDDGTNEYAGEIPTDEGGSGVEFYSIRDYEPGDPVRSIDWRRYANSRELATVEYRAERATQVVCLVDRRRSQNRAQSAAHLPAIDLSVAAAERTFEAILDAGYPTGIIGVTDRLQVIVEPGTDTATRAKGTELLTAIQERDEDPSNHASTRWGSPTALIPTLLPARAQVILFSSFVDDTPVQLIEQLRIRGYPVCVVSPDVATGREDTAGRFSALERRTRLATVRSTGATVVDWDVGQPLGVVLSRVVAEVSNR